MRYVMRIAKFVSHQNFERNLHFPFRGVCLLECLFIPIKPTSLVSEYLVFNCGPPDANPSVDERGILVIPTQPSTAFERDAR